MLRFLLDENIPKLLKKFLKNKGFKAEYSEKALSNSKFAEEAKSKRAIILTRDRDFLKFPAEEYAGIIVFLIHPPLAERLIKGLDKLLSKVKNFEGRCFEILEEDKWIEVKKRRIAR